MRILRPLLAALLLAWAAPGPADPVAVGPEEYARRLVDLQHRLAAAERAEQRRPGAAAAEIARLSASLPRALAVSAGADRPIAVDLSWLKRDLDAAGRVTGRERARRLHDASSRVQRLLAALGVPRSPQLGGAAGDHDRARAVLREILARSEYQPSSLERLFEQVALVVVNLLSSALNLLSRLGVPQSVLHAIPWVIVVLVAVALILVALAVARRLLDRVKDEGEQPARTLFRTPRPAPRTPELLLAAAEQDAAAGRYREAFRSTYLAGILLLDRAGLIAYTDSGTNWEYLRVLRERGARETAETFHGLTTLFDQLIYGKRDVSSDDYEGARRSVSRLEEIG